MNTMASNENGGNPTGCEEMFQDGLTEMLDICKQIPTFSYPDCLSKLVALRDAYKKCYFPEPEGFLNQENWNRLVNLVLPWAFCAFVVFVLLKVTRAIKFSEKGK